MLTENQKEVLKDLIKAFNRQCTAGVNFITHRQFFIFEFRHFGAMVASSRDGERKFMNYLDLFSVPKI